MLYCKGMDGEGDLRSLFDFFGHSRLVGGAAF